MKQNFSTDNKVTFSAKAKQCIFGCTKRGGYYPSSYKVESMENSYVQSRNHKIEPAVPGQEEGTLCKLGLHDRPVMVRNPKESHQIFA